VPQVELRVERSTQVLVLLDLSLSIRGERLALVALAGAVLGLAFPEGQLGLLGFDSYPRWIKKFEDSVDIARQILRYPAGGFTHIERALEEALAATRDRPRTHVLIVSDGRYTEGRDPAPLAHRFRRLSTLLVGKDWSGRALMEEMANHGNGRAFSAREYADLPRTLYQTVRELHF